MIKTVLSILLCLNVFVGIAHACCFDADDTYVFDVHTKEDSAYLRKRLRGVTVRHLFKVSGVNRYFLVTPNTQQPALNKLEFRKTSSVIQYPVGPVCRFLILFDVKDCQPMNATDVNFDNADLSYVKFEFKLPSNMAVAGMGQMLKEFGDTYKAAVKDIKAEVYYLIGRYPPRLYMFLNAGGDKVQQMVDSLVDKAGGPGNVLVNYQHITEV